MADGSGAKPTAEQKHLTLWAAFSAAQEAMPELLKGKVVEKHGTSKSGKEYKVSFKYAPLDVVLKVAAPTLHRFGLALTQPTRVEGDWVMVETRITHAATGESMSCLYPVGQLAKPHSDLGAALTFARRYSLMSILGIFPEGEDAPQQKKKAEPATPDLQQAAAAFRVKLMGATTLTDLQRVWNANHKLRGILDERDPAEFTRIARVYDERVLDFNEAKGGAQ